jgi:phosphoribosylformylglycinamidine synthase
VTNCLNFGSPEDPDVMWQFEQAVTGLADGCLELGIPVTGGNVSFYNQTGDVAIHPTPVVGVLGVIDDVATRTPMAFGLVGDVIVQLGETRDEVAGSEWAHVVHGHLGGLPPRVDLGAERALGEVLVTASRSGLVTAAHDLSDGGLAQVLVEMALRHGVGAAIEVPSGVDAFVFLLSESTARAVVTCAPADVDKLRVLASASGVPVSVIGEVTGTDELRVGPAYGEDVEWTLPELRATADATLPALFG